MADPNERELLGAEADEPEIVSEEATVEQSEGAVAEEDER